MNPLSDQNLRRLGAALALGLSAVSARAETAYQMPPKVLADLVDAPPTPLVLPDPQHRTLLIVEYPNLKPLSELAARELKLAGARINPRTNGPGRASSATGLKFVTVADGHERSIVGLPEPARFQAMSWSPDGSRVSFAQVEDDGYELWVIDASTARARRVSTERLNFAVGLRPVWAPDSRSLYVGLVPTERGPEPPPPSVPAGPVIQESLGRTAPVRTYQDLLRNAYDEALLDHYGTSQLARVDLEGQVTRLGAPALFTGIDPSPDGQWLLVQFAHRPYSYTVPLGRFARTIEVRRAADGQVVKQLADLPVQDAVPITFDSVPAGPRRFEWRADVPATVAWVEALDGGDAKVETAERDRVFTLAAPFTAAPRPLVTVGYRLNGIYWGTGDLALVYEGWWKTRRTRVWRLAPDRPGAPQPYLDYSSEDRYADPGEPLTETNAAGREVLVQGKGGDTLYFLGDGASEEGDRPFLDARPLAGGEPRRLFRSAAPYYERALGFIGEPESELLTHREAVDEPLNFWVRHLVKRVAPRQVTFFPHPTPELSGVKKELIRYQRKDGVELTATLYTPPGWEPSKGPLPLLLWAYPQEFKSASAASQVTDSPYRFVRVGWWSPLLFLVRGYAVLDDPAMPIVGEGDAEPNDTYVAQLTMDAEAAVEEVVRRGVAERGRIAVGGHSYGAFMTANLLAHTNLFAAGIARSGAYNRTLTPFGFQSEERSYWEAPEVYNTMSPFHHADKIDEPLLLVHGEADNNSGTFPIQSERLFTALQGLGKTVRYVVLPHESHGYQARESILHLMWETDRWLETWVAKREAKPAG
ncbi:MAG: prolyl oligopeptidase family serine peptidase [Thermoanaerobaculia bacterium]|nr:prolyl oligopeptidase family serine peptidase [Thermoanaerobaculia bacterium]